MKYLLQFGIIASATFLGELLSHIIPLSVPAGVYGLILLFIGLCTKLIPLHAVKETSAFLLDLMPILFVPAGVGLLEKWGILQPVLIPVTVTVLVSTVLVMVVSGTATQAVIRLGKRKEEPKDAGISL